MGLDQVLSNRKKAAAKKKMPLQNKFFAEGPRYKREIMEQPKWI